MAAAANIAVGSELEAQASAAEAGDEYRDERGLLRFSTAGSVDDGKSTLIGRLLYDSHSLYDDHVRSVTHNAAIDFAQLTDGLRAEREQGITIDVAYRYFSTAKRKFIIADTPGHEQYTRNMATGASTADVAIVLVDARKGILDQTRRHACIASLLGIPLVIAAINKMDMVDFSEEVFLRHRRDLLELGRRLEIPELIAVPVSALEGDNVVHRSAHTPWYQEHEEGYGGASLLELLERVPLAIERATTGFRLPVQRVIRPHQDFRGFAGQVASGTVRPGDAVVALPSGIQTRVRSIATWDGELDEATAPQSIVLTLEAETDISRGDMIVAAENLPRSASRIEATVVWMHARPLTVGASYLLKHTTQTVRATVAAIRSRIDVEHLGQIAAEQLELNAIGEIVLETSRPLLADRYRDNRTTGSFILIDAADNATAGAGMVRGFADAAAAEIAGNAGPDHVPGAVVRGALIHVGNRAGLAAEIERRLLGRGVLVLRTRAADSERLAAVAAAGAVVLVEGEDGAPVRITEVGVDGARVRELAAEEDADVVMETLGRAAVLPGGEGEDSDGD